MNAGNKAASTPVDKLHAPWTDEQVRSLNGFQRSGVMHEFTCPHGHGALTAFGGGWLCMREPDCLYRQKWAWSFMADGSWKQWRLDGAVV